MCNSVSGTFLSTFRSNNYKGGVKMKRLSVLLGMSIFSMLLLSCSNKEENNIPIDSNRTVTSQSTIDKKELVEESEILLDAKEIMKAKIIECKEDSILVTKLDGGENDLYTVPANTPVMENEKLMPGAIVHIGYDGYVQEIYPAKIPSAQYIQAIEQKDDLIGLYKSVFKELFETDKGLNDDITMVALDFTKAENLTSQDKNALVYLIGSMTGLETRLATYEELINDKLISTDEEGRPGSFEKGILVSFEVSDVKEKSFNFTARKWRGPLGAYGFSDCTAKKVGNTWSYKVGAHTIS